jgi:hypothetical protein
MKRHQKLVLVGAMILILALAAAQGRRVRHLRESESFYRWMLAAAVNERLFQDESGQFKDKELFDQCNAASQSLAGLVPSVTAAQTEQPKAEAAPPDAELGDVSQIGQASQEYKNDPRIWALARSGELDEARASFLKLAKSRQLRFAQDIQYAEAQESGVGLFNLFFGFRKVAANFIWIQVDRFWHQGENYRMIALMKTCTALDPHFVEAYLIGAWHLSYNVTAKMMDTPWPQRKWEDKYGACVGEKERYYYVSINFLKDGVRNNPRNYKLYFDLGFAVYKQKLKDYPNAVKYLAEAIRQPHDRWVPRQLFICQELNGQYAEALAGWEDYSRRFPETTVGQDVAPRFIKRNQGHLLEKRAEDAFKAAAAATDPAEADRLRKEALSFRTQAKDIFTVLGSTEGDALRMRIEATELAEEKRYMEAVAILDKARWESAELWDDLSRKIMLYKKEGGLPLSLSEQKEIEREKEAGLCAGMPEDQRQLVLQKNAQRI